MGPIAEAMRMFASSGFVRSQEARGETIYQLEDDRRSELSFYKNTLINLVAGRTIVASAMLACLPDLSKARVKESALVLSRLFKLEFIYPAGKTFEAIFDETVTHLVKLGLILDQGAQLAIAPEPFARPTLTFLADLLRDYLEAYRLAAVTLAEVEKEGSLDKKEFLKRALDLGRAEFLAGLVTCAEALSRTTLENALQYLLEQQYLIEADKKLKRGPNPDQQLAKTVAGYLSAP
jgi:glycerol-3-phosphate O-acyltransferase